MKILSTMRAGRVVRLALYSPRDPNPNTRRRAISIPKEEKKRANLKTSYEKALMLTCANFEPGDLWVTLSYRDADLPPDKDSSKKPWRKFMRLLRREYTKNGDPMKYIYCTQITTRDGGQRVHHHMIIKCYDDSDREIIKKCWLFGDVIYIRYLRDYDDILDKVHYMCREPRELGVQIPGEQMWTASRGLTRPKFEYKVIDNDSVDISVPTGCTALSDPLQLPGYGGYKALIYCEK